MQVALIAFKVHLQIGALAFVRCNNFEGLVNCAENTLSKKMKFFKFLMIVLNISRVWSEGPKPVGRKKKNE